MILVVAKARLVAYTPDLHAWLVRTITPTPPPPPPLHNPPGCPASGSKILCMIVGWTKPPVLICEGGMQQASVGELIVVMLCRKMALICWYHLVRVIDI